MERLTDPDLAEPTAADVLLPADRRRGRGARSNASGRHERESRIPLADVWDEEDEPPPLRTEVTLERARSVISRNDSPDIPFDRSINAYRGCEHGCIYCYARPSHANMNLSPGLDFETRLFAKPDAADVLRKELASPRYVCRPIAMGTNTDPYQPIERRFRITRASLALLLSCNHPVTIVTKSASILDDLDLLGALAERRLVRVALSITTLDRHLARRMEPRASTPARRLHALETLAAKGIPTGVMAAPLIPALNDHELEAILAAARDAGARDADYIVLRLPREIETLFAEWLAEEKPERAQRIMRHVREMRGGRAYDPRFGARMRGEGPYAELIARRFRLAVRRLGLDRDVPALDCSRFIPPAADGAQLSLFG